jgi:hypothetical protein
MRAAARIALLIVSALMCVGALALQGIEKPARLTLTGTTWDELTLPSGTEYIVVRPITNDAQWVRGCTDGGALGTHYRTLAADTDYTIHVGKTIDDNTCLNGTAAAVVEVTPMKRGR